MTPTSSPATAEVPDPAQGLAILEGFVIPPTPPSQGEYGGVRISIFDRRPNAAGTDDLIDNGPW